MKKTVITLLAGFSACVVSAMCPPHSIQNAVPPEPDTIQEDSILQETINQTAIQLQQAVDVVSPFMDFDDKPLDQRREAIGNYASFVRKAMQEERDSYSEHIEADAPDTTYCYFEKGSDIHWGKLCLPSEGLDTQPLVDEYIGTFSQIGPFYLQCPGYDLWERLEMEKHRKEFFSRFFDSEGAQMLGCVLRDGEFVDMQDFDIVQTMEYAAEHQAEIDSVRIQFTFADPGKIRMIALDAQNDRATVGDLDFTLRTDELYGAQLTIERRRREQGTAGDHFIEAVNILEDGRKTSNPDMEIIFPGLRKYTQELSSTLATLDECIAQAKTVSEEGIKPLLERLEVCMSLHPEHPDSYSKRIRVYPESQGGIEIYYIGRTQPRQIVVTKALEKQE